MRVLALETSERIGSVAMLNAQKDRVDLIHSATLPGDQRSAQSLLPALREILAACDWRADDLDLICVTTGPGSFTGLRIGVTVAKTLAYATGAKLIGVPTLSAMAASIPPAQQRLWAILDAQRQELFAACFAEGGQVAAMSAPEVSIVGIDQWMRQLREGDTVVGPPLKKLSERLPAGVNVAEESSWAPQAVLVGRLGIATHQEGKTDDPLQLVPNYYRQSAAEEKADAAKSC
ncbi:MAG: tRNA (adenosine(37)-N6)-threonylcarbamoyltransferase complex dimerization subunit type 1 TsaB [Planctomycetes bacterium]|nr:tRNA (adenosine(37)-N6)-threonylcarbamoyltransferase complex dimerization subunit type 1 TsaB [Planctomycetota bacterium]